MEPNGRSLTGLAKAIGKSRATEALKRRRPLTLGVIPKLHNAWRIPAVRLIRDYDLAIQERVRLGLTEQIGDEEGCTCYAVINELGKLQACAFS